MSSYVHDTRIYEYYKKTRRGTRPFYWFPNEIKYFLESVPAYILKTAHTIFYKKYVFFQFSVHDNEFLKVEFH